MTVLLFPVVMTFNELPIAVAVPVEVWVPTPLPVMTEPDDDEPSDIDEEPNTFSSIWIERV